MQKAAMHSDTCLSSSTSFYSPGRDVLPVLPVRSSSGPAERNQSCSSNTGCLEKIQIAERSTALQGLLPTLNQRDGFLLLGTNVYEVLQIFFLLLFSVCDSVSQLAAACYRGKNTQMYYVCHNVTFTQQKNDTR